MLIPNNKSYYLRRLNRLIKIAKYIHELSITEVLAKYRVSPLGPFWIVASNILIISGLYLVYSRILANQGPNYMSYLSVGIVSWNLIVLTLTESCKVFERYKQIIYNFKGPLWVYVVGTLYVNFILWIHNLPFLIIVFIISANSFNDVIFQTLFTIAGAITGMIVLAPFSLLAAGYSIIYKDLQQAIIVLLQCLLFITPVLWNPQDNIDVINLIVNINPFAYLLNIFRAGLSPSFDILFYMCISSALSLVLIYIIMQSKINPISRKLVKKL